MEDLEGCDGLQTFFTKTEVSFEDVALVAASISSDVTLAQNIVSAAVVSLASVIEINVSELQMEIYSEFDVYQSCVMAYFDAQADFDDVARLSFLNGLAEFKSSGTVFRITGQGEFSARSGTRKLCFSHV